MEKASFCFLQERDITSSDDAIFLKWLAILGGITSVENHLKNALMGRCS